MKGVVSKVNTRLNHFGFLFLTDPQFRAMSIFIIVLGLGMVSGVSFAADEFDDMASTLTSAVEKTTSPLIKLIKAVIAILFPAMLVGAPAGAFFYGKKHAEQRQQNGHIWGAIWASGALLGIFIFEVFLISVAPKVGIDLKGIILSFWSGATTTSVTP